MKRLIQLSFTCIAVCLYLNVEATVWTVSNNANRPAQFTNIQTAIDSANVGDTILITGGTYSTTLTLLKPLVFFGESNVSPTVNITGTVNINRLNSSLSSSGSKFFGIRFAFVTINGSFSGSSTGQETISDLLFERCRFLDYVVFSNTNGGTSNNTFRNCSFEGNSQTSVSNDRLDFQDSQTLGILVTNCVFSRYVIRTGNVNINGGVVIRNSVFIDRTASTFYQAFGLLVENSIFYRCEATGASSSTFNNCLSYLNNNNTLPPGSNLGSGNLVNVNPEFINYPPLGAQFSFSHNYGLMGTSPAIGTGTNGTDIGLTGGNSPVTNIPQFPKIPIVTEVNIPVSSVPVGGTLQINIKANTRN